MERKLLFGRKEFGVESDPGRWVGSTATARNLLDAWELLVGTLVEIPLAFGQAVASRVDAPEGSPADDPYSAIRPKRACRKCNYDLTGSTRYRCADCMESFDLLLVRENASACPTCHSPFNLAIAVKRLRCPECGTHFKLYPPVPRVDFEGPIEQVRRLMQHVQTR